ncbi:MAG: tetraacyldisaccharide 4'-kinase [Planctomycetota bacterium]|nr:tetraacyldisaccharide 4'-kinase [Planctomycetota bacterium]
MSGPLPSILSPVTVPASWVYRIAINRRNRRFDHGTGVVQVGVPVISVGNLTTGGTGKTPMVQWIVERLLDAGRSPAICLRGYGARDGQPGDEQLIYEGALPGTPVLVGPDRVQVLSSHLADVPTTDCAVLDDGFQHRWIDRDLDLVLIDASRPLPNQRLLPAGHLREPLSSLSRAGGVIMTHASEVDDELAAMVEHWHGSRPIAWTDHQWTTVQVHAEGNQVAQRVNWLSGKRVVTRLGVGHADAVHAQIRAAGATVAADMPAGDHAPFGRSELSSLAAMAEGTDGILMTQKDWVKARSMAELLGDHPVIVPDLRLRFVQGQAELLERIEAITSHLGGNG